MFCHWVIGTRSRNKTFPNDKVIFSVSLKHSPLTATGNIETTYNLSTCRLLFFFLNCSIVEVFYFILKVSRNANIDLFFSVSAQPIRKPFPNLFFLFEEEEVFFFFLLLP